MARKPKQTLAEAVEEIQKPQLKMTESLKIGDRQSYTVKTAFTGSYNSRNFNVKPGEVLMLTPDEYATYKRFLQE